ncbi:hypothetical protein L6164_026780 [Bauhinia variegata]|uniref:Uncharacterized protein n=1 Tax=Bauhinia variegata TaxID=167791 RepID=A0ACB9LR68_BAUVA|nr:hypothetical protein L6164_026780 [Bauhinia variegata]
MGKESKRASILFLSIFLFLHLSPLQHCTLVYNITPSQPLSPSQFLTSSPGEVFELGFFSPTNSKHRYVGIWYKKIFPTRIVWVANRENPLEATDSLANLRISLNGNLELQNGEQKIVWSSNISVMSNSTKIASLSDTGNLILRDGFQGETLWQSFDHLGDTFVPSTVVGFNVETGEKFKLVSWKNENDPSPGDFFVEIAPQRPPQAFIRSSNGLKPPHWRSGPWDKTKFSGIPEMDASYLNAFDLKEDVNQGTASLAYNTYSSSTVSNMIILPEGVLKIMRWNPNKSIDWCADWEAPKRACDIYGTCGAFGVCRNNRTPICTCLKGFVPKSTEEWSKENWTSGCVRRSELFCEQITSGLASEKGNMDGFW